MAEAAAEILIVIATLLIGDFVIWFAERMRQRKVEKIRRRLEAA